MLSVNYNYNLIKIFTLIKVSYFIHFMLFSGNTLQVHMYVVF